MSFTDATLTALIELLDASPADCSDGIIPVPAAFVIFAPGGQKLLSSDDVFEACFAANIDVARLREAIDRLTARRRNVETPADPFVGGIETRILFAIAATQPRQPELLRLPRNHELEFEAIPGKTYRLPRICRVCQSMPVSFDCPACQTAGTIEFAPPTEEDVVLQIPAMCPHGMHDRATCGACQRDAAVKRAGGRPAPARPNG